MSCWYLRPLVRRAPRGGEYGVNDRFYKGGRIMPVYVPRTSMPQINEEDYDEFFAFCAAHGVRVDRRTVPPHQLRTRQVMDKIRAEYMTPEIKDKPALVSADAVVLDGNHRWAVHLQLREDLNVFQLSLTFEQAVGFIFRFPKTYTIDKEYQ